MKHLKSSLCAIIISIAASHKTLSFTYAVQYKSCPLQQLPFRLKKQKWSGGGSATKALNIRFIPVTSFPGTSPVLPV